MTGGRDRDGSPEATGGTDGVTESDESDFESAEYLERHGLLSWLGAEIVDVGTGRLEMAIPYDSEIANLDEAGTVHGGVIATLIDTASAHALRTTFEEPLSVGMSTIEVNARYVRPARDDLVATAEVVRAGGSVGVTDVTVESLAPDGESKVVAVGGTSYRLFRDE